MPTTPELLATAIEHYRAGRLREAESICRQVLAAAPNHPDALHLAGVVARNLGNISAALDFLTRAIAADGARPQFHVDLGTAYLARCSFGDAVACFERAIELRPDDPQPRHNLGVAWSEQGRHREAITCYQQALQLAPDAAPTHFNLGNAWRAQGNLDLAVASYERALRLAPGHAGAHNNLGVLLKEQGKLDEAIECYRRAVSLQPDFVAARINLGSALQERGKSQEAIVCCRAALALAADSIDARITLGNALRDQGALDEAVACYVRVLELDPDHPSAHNNLGQLFKDQGRLDEAVAAFRRAMSLKPDRATYHSNLVYTLYFHPAFGPHEIYREHLQWAGRHARPLELQYVPHANDRSPDRRLRVGYVSPDFRAHPVAQFIIPLLEAHDREFFEIYCYSSVRNPDELTRQCRTNADVWRDVPGVSDDAVARLIRDDQIDILVDLTMHMADSRLLVFARRPAPVQVTYLAYCGTTGLSAIDYRLTDPFLDPPGQDDGGEPVYSEESIRLPETYWCYRPPVEIESHGAPPAREAGCVTFGCLNNFCKVTEPTLDAWAQILKRVSQSRLLMHARPGSHRDRVRDFFASRSIAAERLAFADKLPVAEYLRLYNQIDVALDPFPYGGGTTTCDALWMGVPVVSFAGPTAVSRGGLGILSNLGLSELVAHRLEDYLEIACGLARDLPRLAGLRATLRDRMRHSPLMDAPRFARNVEAAYRKMWRRWCAR